MHELVAVFYILVTIPRTFHGLCSHDAASPRWCSGYVCNCLGTTEDDDLIDL